MTPGIDPATVRDVAGASGTDELVDAVGFDAAACRPPTARRACDRRGPLVFAGMAAFAGGAALARRRGVSRTEQRCFRALNGLPSAVFAPTWVVMQLGSLGGPLAPAAGAIVTGRPELGRRIAIGGSVGWAGARVLKRAVRRDRPGMEVAAARILGREQRGLGYPSGHATVAASVAAVVAPHLPPPWRSVVWPAAALVGLTRVYVGAHLPLDVLGGLALGVAIGAAVRGEVHRQTRLVTTTS